MIRFVLNQSLAEVCRFIQQVIFLSNTTLQFILSTDKNKYTWFLVHLWKTVMPLLCCLDFDSEIMTVYRNMRLSHLECLYVRYTDWNTSAFMNQAAILLWMQLFEACHFWFILIMSWLPAELAHVGKYKSSHMKQIYLEFPLVFDCAPLLAPHNSSIINMAVPLQLK